MSTGDWWSSVDLGSCPWLKLSYFIILQRRYSFITESFCREREDRLVPREFMEETARKRPHPKRPYMETWHTTLQL